MPPGSCERRRQERSVGICKPNSVRHRCRGDHSSRRCVAAPLQRPTRTFGGPSRPALSAACAAPNLRPYLVLLRVGFAMQRSLLSARCALTAPFHPYLRSAKAVSSLWHCPSDGLEAAAPGRYPAHCSVEFGLSSPRGALSGRSRGQHRGRRSPDPNATAFDYTPAFAARTSPCGAALAYPRLPLGQESCAAPDFSASQRDGSALLLPDDQRQ